MIGVKKKIALWIILIILSIIFIEFFGHILYRFAKGVFIWEVVKQPVIFNIRPFTEFVNDDRIIANKKNFNSVISQNRIDTLVSRNKGYDYREIEIDSNGFRVGNNNYFEEKDNIVFMGDSVPFGWGIDGDQTVPSKFYDLLMENSLNKYGVINAAVSSYSLYQAVASYQHLRGGRFPIKYVFLQIYDPAPQFVIWGRKWDKRICWTSKNTLTSTQEIAKEYAKITNPFPSFLRRYSFINHVLYKLKLKFKRTKYGPLLLDINDKEAFVLFERENLSLLEDFYDLLKKDKVALIILPANPARPLSTYDGISLRNLDSGEKKLLIATDHFNKILRRFASFHKDVYYFDIVTHFNQIGRKELFIDNQCHLSESGAEKQAEFIFEQLRKNKLL